MLKGISVACRVLLMTPRSGVRVDLPAVERMPPPARRMCPCARVSTRWPAWQVEGAHRFLHQLAARRVWGHRVPLTALVLAAMMSAGVAHAASRSVPPVKRVSSCGVPAYNIQAACRETASIPEARLFESDAPDVSKRCVDDENRAREQLVERWAKFKAADRAMCAGASRSGTVSPTYTELITCLEMTRDNSGSEMTEPRERAQPEPPGTAAAGVTALSPAAVVRAQPVSQSTESTQQTPAQASTIDQPAAPSGDTEIDTGTQVAEMNQTIEKLRSDLASSERKIANLEKDKEGAERAAAQAQQARRDAESAKLQIEEARVVGQADVKHHGSAILAYTTLAALIVLLAIGVSARRRRAVGVRPIKRLVART
jgi:hypothetical protein